MTPINKADLVLKNGKIVTLDPKDDIVEAVAVKDGIIVAAGPAKEIDTFIDKESAVIDLDGKTVAPGFAPAFDPLDVFSVRLFREIAGEIEVAFFEREADAFAVAGDR